MAHLRLDGIFDRRLRQLSGGLRQRVAIDPSVFSLDEPLSTLDANLREHRRVTLRQLQQRLGVTTVVVTHHQKESLTFANIVSVMDSGRVQQVDVPVLVYRDPADVFVGGVFGTSNLLPCTLDKGAVEHSGQRIALTADNRMECTHALRRPGPSAPRTYR